MRKNLYQAVSTSFIPCSTSHDNIKSQENTDIRKTSLLSVAAVP